LSDIKKLTQFEKEVIIKFINKKRKRQNMEAKKASRKNKARRHR